MLQRVWDVFVSSIILFEFSKKKTTIFISLSTSSRCLSNPLQVSLGLHSMKPSDRQHSKLIFNVHLRAHMARREPLKNKNTARWGRKKIARDPQKEKGELASFSALLFIPQSSLFISPHSACPRPRENNKRAQERERKKTFLHLFISQSFTARRRREPKGKERATGN